MAHALSPPPKTPEGQALQPAPALRQARCLPPHLLALFAGVALGGHLALPQPVWLRAPVAAVAAGALGTVLVLASVRLFRRAGTPLRPTRVPRRLVTEGPYRVSRNPMYLGLVLLLVGLGLALGTPLALLAPLGLALWLDRRFVRAEERALAATPGLDYGRYRARVRRWLGVRPPGSRRRLHGAGS